MADFVAVLRKTIEGLAENTPTLRERVYDKARATVAAKLAAINPPPPAAVAQRQKQVLEDAIRQVEASYSGAIADPFAELENVFAEPGKAPAAPEKPQPVRESRAPSSPPVRSFTPYSPPPAPDAASQPAESRLPDNMPSAEMEPFEDTRPPVPFDGEEDVLEDDGGRYEEPARRRNFVPLVAAVGALALVLGGAYAVWLNRDDFMAMLGMSGGVAVASAPATVDTAPVNPPPATARKSSAEAGQAEEPQKFTQRLNSDGSEIDPGPAGGIKSIGEGTSIAAVTQPPKPTAPTETTPPAEAAPANPVNPPADAAPDAHAGDAAGAPDAATPPDTPAAPAAPSGTAASTSGRRCHPAGRRGRCTRGRCRRWRQRGRGNRRGWANASRSPRTDQRDGRIGPRDGRASAGRPEGDLLRRADQRRRRLGRARHRRLVAGAGIARRRPAGGSRRSMARRPSPARICNCA